METFTSAAVCDYLSRYGGQTGDMRAQFVAEKDGDIKPGSEGICLSAGHECGNHCQKIKLARRFPSIALDSEWSSIHIEPSPFIK